MTRSSAPGTDPRRTRALRAYLQRLAPALVPGWSGTDQGATFGRALLEIGARLGEETTSRLDRTAKRDMIAFFDILDVPPTPPRAAAGLVAFSLAEGRTTASFAPSRVQVAAASPSGEEVLFETQADLTLSPGRLTDIFTVDPAADLIERAPNAVASLEPPDSFSNNYQVVTFAGVGSTTLQLTPSLGLGEGDLIRVGLTAHRVIEVDGDLLTLKDPLETPAQPTETVERLTSLQAFDLRNLQEHVFYVGHAELFNLEQPSRIELDFFSGRVPRQLAGLDVRYALYGTKQGEEEPTWHDLESLGVFGTALRLLKDWTGSVDEYEVEGQKNRWLRAELQSSLAGLAEIGTKTNQLCVLVGSRTDSPSETEDNGGSSEQDQEKLKEGSDTISQAFHNGAPLSVTSRFYPFGPEPLRFDVFALAAPEALSKKKAKVNLEVTLVDSSLSSFDIAVGSSNPLRAYGVGQNGYPQALAFEPQGALRWQELNLPALVAAGEEFRLDPSVGLSAVSTQAGAALTDLVVSRDQTGRFWAGLVTKSSSPSGTFGDLVWDDLDDSIAPGAGRFAVVPSKGVNDDLLAFLLQPFEGTLSSLALGSSADTHAKKWISVTNKDNIGPKFGETWQIAAVQGPTWPGLAVGPAEHVVVVDSLQHVWLGKITAASTTSVDVTWIQLIDDAAPIKASLDVCPAATAFNTPRVRQGIWVAWADATVGHPQAYRRDGVAPGEFFDSPSGLLPGRVRANTALHANPDVLGLDRDRPITTGIVDDDGTDVAFSWGGAGDVLTASLPTTRTTRQAFILNFATPDLDVQLVTGGSGEQLLFGLVAETEPVDVEFFDQLTFDYGTEDGDLQTAKLVEVVSTSGERGLIPLSDALVMNKEDKTRLYHIERLATGAVLPAGRTYGNLVKDDTYQFLREVPDGSFTGAFADGDRSILVLADDDTKTEEGDRLLIDDQTYLVSGITTPTPAEENSEGENGEGENGEEEVAAAAEPTVRLAELDREVAGVDVAPNYQRMLVLSSDLNVVTTGNIGTLLKVVNGPNPEDLTKLAFLDGLLPATQNVSVVVNSFLEVGEPWETSLPVSITAYTVAEQAVIEWKQRGLERDYQNPELSWEFFDGDGWRKLEQGFVDGTNDFSATGNVTFRVPTELATTEIGGKEDYWIRARLVGGDYGRPEYIVKSTEGEDPDTGEAFEIQTVTVDNSKLRPPEISSIEATFELDTPAPPELLLIKNNLAVLNQTQAAGVSESRFDLFLGALAIDPEVGGRAVYLGFDALIDRAPLVLYADVKDQRGTGELQAEILAADGWQRATVDDRTASLRRRGKITISANVAPRRSSLFGREGFWVRLRPKSAEDAEGWAPVVEGLYQNAVEVSQAKTIEHEILGTSLGEPGMVIELSERPVLPDTLEIRVRENLSEEEQELLEKAHQEKRRLSGDVQPSTPAVVTNPPQAQGQWVLWERVDSLLGKDGDARVYLFEPSTGSITFGDGRKGKIPPAGRDALRAFRYQQGGGAAGNIPKWSEMTVKSAVEAVDTVILPIDTAGGFETPTVEESFANAPDRLRHASQALTRSDLAALAVSSSSDIVQATCIPASAPNKPIRVVIATRDGSRCPIPTLAQQDAVRSHLLELGWGGLAAPSIELSGPVYRPLAVTVHLLADPADLAAVEKAATDRLTEFLHPVDGGPAEAGWPFGRQLVPSDLLRALEQVDRIDRVQSIEIVPAAADPGSADPATSDPAGPANGGPEITVPDDGMICVEERDISVVVAPVEGP